MAVHYHWLTLQGSVGALHFYYFPLPSLANTICLLFITETSEARRTSLFYQKRKQKHEKEPYLEWKYPNCLVSNEWDTIYY